MQKIFQLLKSLLSLYFQRRTGKIGRKDARVIVAERLAQIGGARAAESHAVAVAFSVDAHADLIDACRMGAE